MRLAPSNTRRPDVIRQDYFYFMTEHRPAHGASHQAEVVLQGAQGSFVLPRPPSSVPLFGRGPVRVTIARRAVGALAESRVVEIVPALLDQIPNAAKLLPLLWAPPIARDALAWLVGFADGLPDPVLREFLSRVLMDPRIGIRLLTARSSNQHHHAYFGGLLVHTVEVMQIAGQMAIRKFGDQPRRIAQCQLAALLHDLGKVVTHPQIRPARRSEYQRHEVVTRHLVEPHMAWLRLADAETARELDAALRLHATPPGQRRRAVSVIAEILCLADQLSAIHFQDGARKDWYAMPAANDPTPQAIVRSQPLTPAVIPKTHSSEGRLLLQRQA